MEKFTVRNIQRTILVLTTLFLVLSFAPCMEGIGMPMGNRVISIDGFRDGKSYLPGFCAVISVLEVLLLVKVRGTWGKVIRILLDLVKTFSPISLIELWDAVFDTYAGGMYAISYRLSIFGYVIIAVGILIAMFTGLEIAAAAREKH